MLVDVYTKDGQKSGQIELPDDVFAVEPNEHAMHLAVVQYLANHRQGTRKTKLRSEVSGGGKKPWRQKGRGTARAGSTRSPLWVGGGTIHGPKPTVFEMKLPKKIKRLARKSALSLRAKENNLMVVEDFSFDEIKTKSMAQILKNLQLDGASTLLLLPQPDYKLYMSARNIPKVEVAPADKISTYDILKHKKIVLFKGAVEPIQKTFNN
jgi:large subunit ribosomal protein L4